MQTNTPTKPSAPLADAVPFAYPYPAPAPLAQPVGGHAGPSVAYERSTTVTDDGVRVGQWEAGLCGCFTHLVPNCLLATCCPCVSLAQTASRVGVAPYAATLVALLVVVAVQCAMSGLLSYEVYRHENSTDWADSAYDNYWGHWHGDEDYGTAYHVYSAVSCAAEVVVFVFVWHLRAKIRDRFELPGNCCGDFWVSLCCSCCSIAQMATHVKSYQPGSCSFGPPDTLPAYPRGPGAPQATAASYV